MTDCLKSMLQVRRRVVYLDMLQSLFASGTGDVTAHKNACLKSIIEHVRYEDEAVSVAALSCLSTVADSLHEDINSTCALLLDINSSSASEKIR